MHWISSFAGFPKSRPGGRARRSTFRPTAGGAFGPSSLSFGRMNPQELLRIVDSLHREKNIDPELVLQAIEAALMTAAKKQFGEESDIAVKISRDGGVILATCDGRELDQEEVGRIGAQTAKQVIIQKIREAERDARMDEFQDQVGHLVTGVVQRTERGVTIVQLGAVEAILPRSEQIPGESYHNGERVCF